MTTWTREKIIRDICRRESAGLPLCLSVHNQGVEAGMYQAASRIFGSWKNAVTAAGFPASRARKNSDWTPARIKKVIRSLSHRKQPLGACELKNRYGHFVAAARRQFGSWSRAVIAAGIDPQRMRRAPTWSRERVIEQILTLALRNEPLQRRLVQPRAFVEAATRLFGSWKAAVAAAGLDLNVVAGCQPLMPSRPRAVNHAVTLAANHRPHTRWTDDDILSGISRRFRDNLALYATAVYDDDRALYRAATRRFGNWKTALQSAGLDPTKHRKRTCREPYVSE